MNYLLHLFLWLGLSTVSFGLAALTSGAF